MAANGISTSTVGNPVDWEATKLARKNAKLEVAKTERQGTPPGNTDDPNYRPYNKYTSPGTVSPAEGHPWTK